MQVTITPDQIKRLIITNQKALYSYIYALNDAGIDTTEFDDDAYNSQADSIFFFLDLLGIKEGYSELDDLHELIQNACDYDAGPGDAFEGEFDDLIERMFDLYDDEREDPVRLLEI